MKEIWLRAWRVLRDNPVLWLPVIVADVIGQVGTACMTMVDQAIFRAMTAGSQSVLGGPPDTSSLLSARMTEIVFLTLPVMWGSYFVRALAFASALVATGVLVWGIERASPVGVAVVWGAVRSRLGRAARFAGVLVGVCYVGVVVFLGGLTWLLMALDKTRLAATAVFAYGTTLVGMVVVSWLMAPWALRLARADGAEEPDRAMERMARRFTISAGVVSAVIYAGAMRFWHEFAGWSQPHRMVPGSLFLSALSLLCALPYTALFLVLACIADGGLGGGGDAELVKLRGE